MADQIACVTMSTPATATTLDVTSPSITDAFSGAILIFTRDEADDANNAHAVLGVGFIGVDSESGVAQCTIAIQAENGEDVSQECNTDRSDVMAMLASSGVSAGTAHISAVYNASIAGGVQLNFTTVNATGGPAGGPVRTKFTAILFAGFDGVSVGNCTASDEGAHEDVGPAGSEFQPDIVVFRSSDNTVNTDTANGTLALGFAVRTSPIQQKSAYINMDDAADPTDSDGYLRSDCCSAAFAGVTDRTQMDRLKVTSFDSTGFNFQGEIVGINSPQANYIALKFSGDVPNMAVANLPVSSSTGVQSFAVGFQPSLVLGMSTLMTSEDSIIDGSTASSAGYFVFTSAYQRAYSVHNEENRNLQATDVVVSIAATRQGDYSVLTLGHTGAVAQQATFSSFTGTGFNLNFSTATAGMLTLLAIGSGTANLVQSDTETITETVGFAGALGAQSETVTITDDTLVMFTTDVSVTQGLEGETFAARAERGTSFQGGAIEGTVLGQK